MATDEIREMLNTIIQNQNEFRATITAIDSSITGDEKRGVIGIKQHIESIQENHAKHIKDDAIAFGALTANYDSLGTEFKGVKKWIAGAVFVVITLSGAIQLIASVKKAM